MQKGITQKQIWLIYSIVTAILIIALGIGFIISSVRIYSLGVSPYTTDNISRYYSYIKPLVYALFFYLILGVILFFLLPSENEKPKLSRNEAITLKRLLSRVDSEKSNSGILLKIAHKKRLLIFVRCFFLIISLVLLIPFLTLLFSKESFGGILTVTKDVTGAVKALIPFAFSVIAFCTASLYIDSYVNSKALALLKVSVASGEVLIKKNATSVDCGKPKDKASFIKKHSKKLTLALRCVLFSLAILFIIVGIMNGGARDVLEKAIRICTECIGLG